MSIPFTWVYLIHDPFTKYHKIGQSDKPEERLKQLCNQPTILPIPFNFVLRQAWLCPGEIEKEFHEEFAEKRVRGEWFNLTSRDVWRIYDALSWYRRYKGNEPDASVNYKIYKDAYNEISEQLRKLRRENQSLVRQRQYLVNQRDTLITFLEDGEFDTGQPDQIEMFETVA